jgi:hypothetical protein
MKNTSPQERLEEFIDKYTPEVGATARAALARLRERVPGAVELVYDNYNALAIGFAASERASDVVVSLALYPRWVSLFFLQGAQLPDPRKVLRGGGKIVRHVVLKSADDLDEPTIRELIAHALELAPKKFDATSQARIVIKSVSAKQRPRRPAVSPRGKS